MKEYEVKIAQKCLIYNDSNEILILQRKSNHDYDNKKWDIPGGKVIVGENHVESLEREIFEETKLKVRQFNLVDIHTTKVDDLYFFVVIYKSKYNGEPIKVSKEHYCYEWVKIEDLPNYKFNNVVKGYIEKIQL